MDIRQLLYFTTIAEEGSISAAAKKLHLSQPPLSYQMKLLEEELHLPLIERSARGIALTEAGRVLYKRAQGIAGVKRADPQGDACDGIRLHRYPAHRDGVLLGRLSAGLAHPRLPPEVSADWLCHPRGQHL